MTDVFKEILDRNGIPQLFTTIKTVTTASKFIKIGNNLPTDIGLIYGVSISVGATNATLDDEGVLLITEIEASNLWLRLKKGVSDVFETMRLDKLIFTLPSATVISPNEARYLPMLIPPTISLDTSGYKNPTNIATGGEVMLELWYITKEMLQWLMDTNQLPKDIVLNYLSANNPT